MLHFHLTHTCTFPPEPLLILFCLVPLLHLFASISYPPFKTQMKFYSFHKAFPFFCPWTGSLPLFFLLLLSYGIAHSTVDMFLPTAFQVRLGATCGQEPSLTHLRIPRGQHRARRKKGRGSIHAKVHLSSSLSSPIFQLWLLFKFSVHWFSYL